MRAEGEGSDAPEEKALLNPAKKNGPTKADGTPRVRVKGEGIWPTFLRLSDSIIPNPDMSPTTKAAIVAATGTLLTIAGVVGASLGIVQLAYALLGEAPPENWIFSPLALLVYAILALAVVNLMAGAYYYYFVIPGNRGPPAGGKDGSLPGLGALSV